MIYNFSFYFCPSSFLVSLWSNLMNGVQGNPLVELTHGMWAEGSIYHLTMAHQHVWSFEMCVTLKNVRPRTWQNTEGEYSGVAVPTEVRQERMRSGSCPFGHTHYSPGSVPYNTSLYHMSTPPVTHAFPPPSLMLRVWNKRISALLRGPQRATLCLE